MIQKDCFEMRLRLGLSDLRKHRFNYNCGNSVTPLSKCNPDVESTTVSIIKLPLQNYPKNWKELKSIVDKILKLSDNTLIELLLFGGSQFDNTKTNQIHHLVTKYTINSNQFSVPLLYYNL